MRNVQITGYISSVVLVLGVFMPIASLPIIGTVTYFANGQGDGWIVLAMAALALILLAAKQPKFLWLPGIASLVLLLIVFGRIMDVINKAHDALGTLDGNPFKGLAEQMVGAIQIEFGWIVLVVGAIGLVVASVMAFKIPKVEVADFEGTALRESE